MNTDKQKISAPNEAQTLPGYIGRARNWYEFQQHQGLSFSDIVTRGLDRLRGKGFRPSVISANDENYQGQNQKAKGKTVSPADNRQLQQLRYEQWIEQTEARHKALQLPTTGPLISVVVPVFDTPMNLLVECIESVQEQVYQNWQLILVDDHSSTAGIASAIRYYGDRDDRITPVYLSSNQHIAKASQAGLNAATGDFVAFLDHDDRLSDRALARVAYELQQHPRCRFIYSDEDKIGLDGQRSKPHFKSDWNPELLLAQNYICHLSVIERQLVIDAGGFREGFEGSQDHDLILRCTAKIDAANIRHIAEVLYHWRTSEGSTAAANDAKYYTSEAGVAAVQDYLDHHIPGASAEPAELLNTYRIHYPLPDDLPRVCLIIPTRDQKALTQQAIDSILSKTRYDNFEILLIDNDSTEPDALEYFESLKTNDKVRVLAYDQAFNYSAINNFAVQHTNADVIGLINNDVEVISENWLSEMVAQAIRPENGCVGAKLYYAEDKIQHAGVIIGIGGVAGHSHKYYHRKHHGYYSRLRLNQNLSAVTGACMVVRKSLFEELKGLNEEHLTVAFNDVDFCLRVSQAGYRNVWTPYAELYHHESISRGEEDSPEKVARFNKEADWMREQWAEIIQHDPFYSPNLSLKHEDFSIRLDSEAP